MPRRTQRAGRERPFADVQRMAGGARRGNRLWRVDRADAKPQLANVVVFELAVQCLQ